MTFSLYGHIGKYFLNFKGNNLTSNLYVLPVESVPFFWILISHDELPTDSHIKPKDRHNNFVTCYHTQIISNFPLYTVKRKD